MGKARLVLSKARPTGNKAPMSAAYFSLSVFDTSVLNDHQLS
jgi:hypothetical protein